MDATTLWNSGREYERGKFLSDYIGKNEKTKIVCKFSKKGNGAPVREPMVDKETQQKMLQFYFKKQEEIKVELIFEYRNWKLRQMIVISILNGLILMGLRNHCTKEIKKSVGNLNK